MFLVAARISVIGGAEGEHEGHNLRVLAVAEQVWCHGDFQTLGINAKTWYSDDYCHSTWQKTWQNAS
jgi:hypothetical protein